MPGTMNANRTNFIINYMVIIKPASIAVINRLFKEKEDERRKML
jgi:hypothetical protein